MLTRSGAAAESNTESQDELVGVQATNSMAESPHSSSVQTGATCLEAHTGKMLFQASEELERTDYDFKVAILKYLGLPTVGQDPVAEFSKMVNSTTATVSKLPTSKFDWDRKNNRLPEHKSTVLSLNQHGQEDIDAGVLVNQAMNTLALLAESAKSMENSQIKSKIEAIVDSLANVFEDGLQDPQAQQMAAASHDIPVMTATNPACAASRMRSSATTTMPRMTSRDALTEGEALGARPKSSKARCNRGPPDQLLDTGKSFTSMHRESLPHTGGEQFLETHTEDTTLSASIPIPYCPFKNRFDPEHRLTSVSMFSNVQVFPPNFKCLNVGGGNFAEWVKNVQVIMMKENVLSLLLDPPTKPWSLEVDISHHKAFCIMLMSIDPALYPSIPSNVTITDIWLKLHRLFSFKNSQVTNCVYREFYSSKLREGTNISEHLCELNRLRQELLLRGEAVSERTLISVIINSLNGSWDSFIARLDNLGHDSLTLETLSGKLIAEDNLRRDRATFNRKNKPLQNPSSIERTYALGECFICGSREHYRRDCPQSKSVRAGPKGSSGEGGARRPFSLNKRKRGSVSDHRRGIKPYRGNVNNHHSSSVSSENLMEVFETDLTKEQREQLWLLDSGASNHVVSNRRLFINMREHRSMVKVANGEHIRVEGIGDIYIPGIGEIKNALFVPGINHNLLSLMRICEDQGIEVKFSEGAVMIWNDKRSIGEVLKIGGLPYYSPNASSKIREASNCISLPDDKKKPSLGSDRLDNRQTKPYFNHDFKNFREAEREATNPVGANTVSLGEPLHSECVHLMHRRLGHVSFPVVKKVLEHARGTKLKECSVHLDCAICKSAKSRVDAAPKKSQRRSDYPFQLVHMDLVGPFAPSIGKRKYFLTIVDDYSRYGYVYPLKSKNETFDSFKEFCNLIENQHKTRVGKILTDRGTEFNSSQFSSWLKRRGIIHLRTAPYSAFQNGVAERRNGVLQSMLRCALEDAELNFTYWVEALMYANYNLNRVWSSVVEKTPYEVLYGHKPNLAHIHVFGAIANVHVPKETRTKGDPVSVKMRFMGYEPGSKAYRFASPRGKLVISRSASFHEGTSWSRIHANEILTQNPQRASGGQKEGVVLVPPVIIDMPDPGKGTSREQTRKENSGSVRATRKDRRSVSESCCTDDDCSDTDDGQTPRRWPVRTNRGKRPQKYDNHVTSVCQASNTPQRYEDVLNLPYQEKQKWITAMTAEYNSLKGLDVFVPTKLQKDQRVIGTRWLFKKKPIEGGEYIYKARIVAQGFSQRFPDDYEDTFSPTVRPESVRTALTIAAMHGQFVHQFDIQTAYLHAQLDKEIHVRVPQGIDHKDDIVWLLNKSLYGLKQSGKRWYECLAKSLEEMGYLPSSADECVFVRKKDREIVLVYVDDIIHISGNKSGYKGFSERLSKKFALKYLGQVNKFLGVKFVRTEKGFHLSQEEKIHELLEKCGMVDAKPYDTPMTTDFLKNMYMESASFENKTFYKSVIGSLLYIANWTRPDISLSVNILSRHAENPTQYHWGGVKRLLRYLKGTTSYSLTLEPEVTTELDLYCYSDADWAGDAKSRKSTSGYIVYVNHAPVYWYSGKQKLVATSTAEAEYVSLSKASNNLVWFDDLLENIWKRPTHPIKIHEDNMAAISISEADAIGKRSRHIDIRHKHVRQLVKAGFIKTIYCETKEQIADVFTKPLPREQHHYLLKSIPITV